MPKVTLINPAFEDWDRPQECFHLIFNKRLRFAEEYQLQPFSSVRQRTVEQISVEDAKKARKDESIHLVMCEGGLGCPNTINLHLDSLAVNRAADFLGEVTTIVFFSKNNREALQEPHLFGSKLHDCKH